MIPAKYRELIGLVIAANIKCFYCQGMHLSMAKYRGASEEELSELDFLASLTARWSAKLHAQHYDMYKYNEDAKQIGKFLTKKPTMTVSQRSP